MGSLIIQSDGKGQGQVDLTVTQSPPVYYAPATWKLFVTSGGRTIFTSMATSLTFKGRMQPAIATFSGTRSIALLRNCDECEFYDGNYRVIGTNDRFDPPSVVIDSGSVRVVGEVGCCPDDEDDGGGDTGGGGPDPLPPNPSEPSAPCVPSPYTAGTPPVSTPCSTGSGGSGPSGFGTP